MQTDSIRIGVISTRLAGTDGVSLEAAKWTHVLHDLGHTCWYFAGECDQAEDRSRVVPEAHFTHPAVKETNEGLFGQRTIRTLEMTELVHDLRVTLKRELHAFIQDFEIGLLLIENALSLPMNVPLGLAIAEVIAETNIPTIAHHHDFYWERERFSRNAAQDFLQAAFPPAVNGICHVVINSYAATELARRTGIRSLLIPNVMDFDHFPPPDLNSHREIRSTLGLEQDEVFLLQPTRVVPRKCIERSIEISRWLGRPNTLVVSHAAGDEGHEYGHYLTRLAETMDVKLKFADDVFNYSATTATNGHRIYSLAEAYHCCDLVTYPSRVEGFGNAFLEAIYFRRPLIISGYEIFKTDIEPKGFRVIDMGSFVTESVVESARQWLDDPQLVSEITEHNYELGRRHYSMHILRENISTLIQHRFPDL